MGEYLFQDQIHFALRSIRKAIGRAPSRLPFAAKSPPAPKAFFKALDRFFEFMEGRTYGDTYPDCCALPLPVEVETELATNIEAVEAFNDQSWRELRDEIDRIRSDRLMVFAFRMAMLATSTNDPRHIYHGMLASILGDDDCFDYRDLIVVTDHLHDAALRIGDDFRPIVRRVAWFATPRRARLVLRHHVQRGFGPLWPFPST